MGVFIQPALSLLTSFVCDGHTEWNPFLFRHVANGLQALRVYTVNPDLNHDECMTMLAAAGIYLILDVNSPRVGESLNRYEPWTSYTPEYLEHILKVVHQFSGYNNTLGFFAGNEVVNDDRSASNSPNYLKAVIRDVKTYIRYNAPRTIPVGYSAADDLRYRISLSKYLECGDDLSTVDFYGVNSYQWCGKQTFTSSGYDVLVNDYKDYSLPLFFSEFGCNAVTPRHFQEIEALFSTPMTTVFSGGLVYEFSQEPNNYGLVEMDPNGDVYLMADFDTLAKQYKTASTSQAPPTKKVSRPKQCLDFYDNINTRNPLPDTFASSFIAKGIGSPPGQYVNVTKRETTHKIFGTDDKEITNKKLISPFFNWNRKPSTTKQSPEKPRLDHNEHYSRSPLQPEKQSSDGQPEIHEHADKNSATISFCSLVGSILIVLTTLRFIY